MAPAESSDIFFFTYFKSALSTLELSPDYRLSLFQCCGAACPGALKMFEDQLSSLGCEVDYTKATAFIPSFLEDWLFYQIWKKEKDV